MQETVHFVTHQELWWFIGAGISLSGIIIGIIMNSLHRSNKSYISKEVEEIKTIQSRDLLETRKEMNEIRTNYRDRLDEIKKTNQEILITLEKIKTQIEYINQKQK